MNYHWMVGMLTSDRWVFGKLANCACMSGALYGDALSDYGCRLVSGNRVSGAMVCCGRMIGKLAGGKLASCRAASGKLKIGKLMSCMWVIDKLMSGVCVSYMWRNGKLMRGNIYELQLDDWSADEWQLDEL